MRATILSLLVLGLFLVATSSLKAQDDLRAIIDKAIKAQGGEERINKHKAGTSKSKGTVDVQGMSIDFTEEAAFHLPNKVRSTQHLDINGKPFTVIVGFDGAKAWLNVNGNDVDEKLDKIADLMKEQVYLSEVTRLTTLKDKKFELSSLGEVKVQDKPAIGIRVASKEHKDINLYFDKDTGLMVKIDHRTVDINTQQEVNEERIITVFQDKDGAKEPKKAIVNRDGKKYIDVEILEINYQDNIDDTQFSKP
jgi:hypothetical protein